MLKLYRIIMLILVAYTSACANKAPRVAESITGDTTVRIKPAIPDSFATGKLIASVACKADPGQTYALYIPSGGNGQPLPVIYFFDPHANGALPLSRYQALAEAYGFILIGSNNSKNGTDWPATESIWRNLWDDTQGRLKINGDRVYVCGFSGGAKVAGYVGMRDPRVKGVIANGAGLPDGTPAGDFSFSFTAIAGEGDLNLTDLVGISNELDKTHTRHRIIFFEGRHEWAPESSMGLAFAGLQFDAMKGGQIPKDGTFINQYIEKSKKRLDTYYKANQLIKAGQECRLSISFLDGLSDEAVWYKAKAAALAGNAQYQKQQQAQDHLLVVEQTLKEGYMQQIQQGDMASWNKTIGELHTKANAKTAESGMDQRLLAYLSLVFYSYSNHLINSNANGQARYFTELYKLAEPGNSEAWYFSAILDARAGQAGAAESDLLKAAGCGFRDISRMRQQPEFQQLSSSINFAGIEAKMNGPAK